MAKLCQLRFYAQFSAYDTTRQPNILLDLLKGHQYQPMCLTNVAITSIVSIYTVQSPDLLLLN